MRVLRKVKAKLNIDKIKYNFFVFDTETTCLEPQAKNFVFGVIYGYNFYKVIKSVKDFRDEFENPKYKGKTIFAHNAEFDLLTIFGNIYTEIDNSAIFNGRFITCKYKGITFADSMNIYPSSVKKIGEVIGLSKIDNQKVSNERLTRKNVTNKDIEYCIRDCEIIFKALLRIFEMTKGIKITLPGIALNDFRTNYLEKDLYYSPLVDEFFDSYYGGRNEAFYVGTVNAQVYDVNSMYPYVMSVMMFPDVYNLKKDNKVNKKFLHHALDYYEGMANVTVKHKNSYFGYLPLKDKINGSEKLIFPTGVFNTTVNFNELRFAVISGIVDILSVNYVVYSNPVSSPFKEFIDDKYQLRQSTDNELDKMILKLQMNALYGKFGQRMKYKSVYYSEIPYDYINACQQINKFCEVQTFNLMRNDCFLIMENSEMKGSYHSIPLFASYITSEARLFLLKNLLANEKNNVVYCDTDSIFVDNPDRIFSGHIATDLGAFKLECKNVTQIRGLKNYTYTDEKNNSFDVIKGISKNSTKTVDIATGQASYTTRKYYKTLQSLRQNKEAGQGYEQKKILAKVYDKRQVLLDGSTRPLTMPLSTVIRERKKPVVPSRVRAVLSNEPNTIHEAILHFFISGGKVRTSDLIRHGLKHKLFIYGKKTGTPLDLISENFPEYLMNEDSGFNIPDMILNVISEYTTKWQMIIELEKNYCYEPSQMSIFY